MGMTCCFHRSPRRRRAAPVWAALLALFLAGCVNEKAKVFRVGVLCGGESFLPVVDGFKAGLAEQGFVEDERVHYDVHVVNADPAGERRAAAKLVADGVDLVFSVPTQASVTAQAAIRGTDIPLVFAYAGVEGVDLVQSVRAPGRNTTGLRFPGPEQISKRLELLLEFAPRVARVWIGYDTDYPNAVPTLGALRPLALSKGITLVEVPASSLEEIEADLAQRARQADPGMDAIILMPDTLNHSPAGWGTIRAFAAAHKIPVCGSFRYTVEQGALFGNADNLVSVGELTAALAAKVLNGMPAGEIPVVTPVQELIINYKVAQEMELEVPDRLLRMATTIIR